MTWTPGPQPSQEEPPTTALDDVRQRTLAHLRRGPLPLPGSGATLERWRALASMTGDDVVAGRLAEAHLDAAAISTDMGRPDLIQKDQLWGVWAAEPPQPVLSARLENEGWVLEGTKPWCSGASLCTHALVTARTQPSSEVMLFAVDLSHEGVEPVPGTWHAVGMGRSDSGQVTFQDVPAHALGTHAQYLERPGFWLGGIGVAACWFGGARAVAEPLLERARSDRAGEILRAHAGAVAAELSAGWSLLAAAAQQADEDPDDQRGTAQARALLVRTRLDRMASTVIERTGRALGPGPLCSDAQHAQRVADLEIYIRQTHAEHDEAAIPGSLGPHTSWEDLLGFRPSPQAEAARLFQGAEGPAVPLEALMAYDSRVPQWEAGDVDEQGRWAPHDMPGLLVVAPHPDDEILGASALLGGALRAGSQITVLAVSDGEGSHIDVDQSPETASLAEIRTAESRKALDLLADSIRAAASPTGVTSEAPGADGSARSPIVRERLRLPDGDVASYQEQLTEALVGALGGMPAGTVVAAPLPTDGHPDHDASGRAAEAAAGRTGAGLVHYPVWLWHHSAPEDAESEVPWQLARSIPVDADLQQARTHAMACYASQVRGDLGAVADREPGEPMLPPQTLKTVLREQQIVFPYPAPDFRALYRESPDPWRLSSRWYEERKYDLTMSVLPRRRFARAYEPGCSIGVLTQRLAARCDELISADLIEEAARATAARVPDDHVQVRHAGVDEWPEGTFDLIVLSELAYYLLPGTWERTLENARTTLAPEGVLVSVHWRRPDPGALRHAQRIRQDLRSVPGWVLHGSYDDADMLIDVVGPPAPSVAEAEFLRQATSEAGQETATGAGGR